MTVRIDKSGRLVIPKSVCDRLGLVEGDEFEITEIRDGLVIKALPRDSHLEEVGGVLVHRGRPE